MIPNQRKQMMEMISRRRSAVGRERSGFAVRRSGFVGPLRLRLVWDVSIRGALKTASTLLACFGRLVTSKYAPAERGF